MAPAGVCREDAASLNRARHLGVIGFHPAISLLASNVLLAYRAGESTRRDTDLRCRESSGKVSTALWAPSGEWRSAMASSMPCVVPN